MRLKSELRNLYKNAVRRSSTSIAAHEIVLTPCCAILELTLWLFRGWSRRAIDTANQAPFGSRETFEVRRFKLWPFRKKMQVCAHSVGGDVER